MILPTLDSFKTQFFRDFAFSVPPSSLGLSGGGDDPADDSKVLDVDITMAQKKALMSYNEALFTTAEQQEITFNLLTAHFLVVALQAASQGLGGAGFWLVKQKTVGELKETYETPDFIAKNPTLAQFSRTMYGCEYLTQLTPRLRGNVQTVYGATGIV
jgi:hypothetical protein